MPPKQVQKTRTKTKAVAITTKTAISQKQSQEFVQTVLHGALSGLSYLRGFFVKEAYDGRVLGSAERLSYRDYADAKLPTDLNRAKKPYSYVQILRRGRGRRADKFLDWLEKSVFPTIENSTLRALQIYVHVDGNDREKVVETYTFTIDYQKNEDGEEVAGVAMDGPGGRSFTVESTFEGMQGLLNELMKVCKTLPALPEERYISVVLHLRDEGDLQNPKGFKPVESDVLRFGEGDGWEKSTTTLEKKMSSGFHATSLRISHLRHPAFDGFASGQHIPDQLEYPKHGSKKDDIEEPDVNATKPSPSTTATTSIIEPVAVDPTSNTLGRTSALRDLDSQISNIPTMKRSFQGMMQPERLTQGDTQTQAMGKTPIRSGSEQLTLLSPEKSRLDEDTARLTKIAKKMGKSRGGNETILCQCGHLADDDVIVECSFCDTWQHMRCYGFSGKGDPRVPEFHACYQCLFSGQKEKIKKMRDLVLKRRAMAIALKDGLKRKGGIAEDLGVDTPTAGAILAYLRDEGFITPTAFSHKPGFPAQGLPFWVPVREGPAFEKMLQTLFDPLLHLEDHYYSLAGNTPLAVSKELLAIMSPDMPDGATPKRKSRQPTSPASSGLDVVTGYKTPMFPGTLKRRGEADENSESTAKRRATTPFRRLKAVQSNFILSADGKPSPANPATGQTN